MTKEPKESDFFLVERVLKTKTIKKKKYYFCKFLFYPGSVKYGLKFRLLVWLPCLQCSLTKFETVYLIEDKFNLWLPEENFKQTASN